MKILYTMFFCFRTFVVAPFLWLLFIPLFSLSAQNTFPVFYYEQAPRIDGVLNDSVWKNAEAAHDFTTSLPRFGQKPAQSTEVKLVECPFGLAFGVVCYDGRVRADRSIRDEVGTADFISIGLDTWNDDQNAFVFMVTAGGANH